MSVETPKKDILSENKSQNWDIKINIDLNLKFLKLNVCIKHKTVCVCCGCVQTWCNVWLDEGLQVWL